MNNPIETLSEIRSMMDRSSRFISLSGLSGISAGILALAGALVVWAIGNFPPVSGFNPLAFEVTRQGKSFPALTVLIASIILVLAVSSAIFFTSRNTKKKGLPLWDNTSRRFLINLSIPLLTGGIFCIILIIKGYYELVVPVTLLFYGMSLLNGSKYALKEIRYLAIIQIILGLLSSWLSGWDLLLWSFGFGICHIFYGIKMYYRYEK